LTRIYSSLLTAKHVSAIADQYGFADRLSVEKFIMDFEMHHHITRQVECITRGGMCMPFHLPMIEARRLSVDIDLLTPRTVDEIRDVMGNIGQTVSDIRCDERVPRDPYPIDSLISYDVRYDSCLGGQKSVKVDFLCDVNIPLSSQLVKPGFALFAFDTKHEVNILSRGSLLGDKITTMALGTIGLKHSKQTEIAKQIYDLGALLKTATKSDLEAAFDTFESMTELKVSHFDHDPKYAVSDVVNSIDESASGLLNLESAVSITDVQAKRYADFQGTYLAKRARYKKTEHVTDVLLVNLYSKHIRRCLDGEVTRTQAADSLHDTLRQADAVKNIGIDSAPKMRASYMREIPDYVNFNKKILGGALLEHIFLVRKLYP